MAAPRLRLLVTAWMRGLVKPGYPYGVQSIVRENLLLEALDKELQGNELLRQSQLEAAALPLLAKTHVRQGYRQAAGLNQVGCALLRNHKYEMINGMLRALKPPSMEETVAAFNLVKNTSIFEDLRKTLQAAAAEGMLTPD